MVVVCCCVFRQFKIFAVAAILCEMLHDLSSSCTIVIKNDLCINLKYFAPLCLVKLHTFEITDIQ